MVDPDTRLMLDFVHGDPAAFPALVRRNQDMIFKLAYRYLSDHAEAEDVAQEVFLKVHGAVGAYQPTAKFGTWVYRITVNLCLNRLRANRLRRSVSLESGGEGEEFSVDPAAPAGEAASGRLEREEFERKVREAMADLPDSQRTAVLLRRFDELSYEEIAEVMDTSIPAVKSLLARARQSLKSRLTRYL